VSHNGLLFQARTCHRRGGQEQYQFLSLYFRNILQASLEAQGAMGRCNAAAEMVVKKNNKDTGQRPERIQGKEVGSEGKI